MWHGKVLNISERVINVSAHCNFVSIQTLYVFIRACCPVAQPTPLFGLIGFNAIIVTILLFPPAARRSFLHDHHQHRYFYKVSYVVITYII